MGTTRNFLVNSWSIYLTFLHQERFDHNKVLLSATMSTPLVARHVAFIMRISAITHDLANVGSSRRRRCSIL
jgi:hypothetical protein